MKTFLVRYYDIGWNVHSAIVSANTKEEATEILIKNKTCVRYEVITHYDITEETK